jgi:hypothetical protein
LKKRGIYKRVRENDFKGKKTCRNVNALKEISVVFCGGGGGGRLDMTVMSIVDGSRLADGQTDA